MTTNLEDTTDAKESLVINAKDVSVHAYKGRLHFNDLYVEARKINKYFKELYDVYLNTPIDDLSVKPVTLRRFSVKRDVEIDAKVPYGVYFCEERIVIADEFYDQEEHEERIAGTIAHIKQVVHFTKTTKEMYEFLRGITFGLSH